jgi:hypothetical protein
MHILVFDLNLVFARQVAKILNAHLKDVQIDFANNLMLLGHNLREYTYDLILADTDTAVDCDMATQLLQSVETPVILWSVLDRRQSLRETPGSNIQRVQKPKEPRDVVILLESKITTVQTAS